LQHFELTLSTKCITQFILWTQNYTNCNMTEDHFQDRIDPILVLQFPFLSLKKHRTDRVNHNSCLIVVTYWQFYWHDFMARLMLICMIQIPSTLTCYCPEQDSLFDDNATELKHIVDNLTSVDNIKYSYNNTLMSSDCHIMVNTLCFKTSRQYDYLPKKHSLLYFTQSILWSVKLKLQFPTFSTFIGTNYPCTT
jgi:hypothetical protein